MKVVGLDMSLAATGYCHPDGTTETLLSQLGGMERIRDLAAQAVQRVVFHEGGTPDLVVIEDYAFSRGGHAHEIGELGGVVKNHLIDLSQRYLLVSPSAVKKFGAGKGNANKIAMAVSAAKLGREFADDNQCDAWWLRELALYRYDADSVTAPRTVYRDEVVNKIVWPTLGEKACSG